MPQDWSHQDKTLELYNQIDRSFDTSDAGTGKTKPLIDSIKPELGSTLILCPKSLMATVWSDEIAKFRPELLTQLCYAKNREEAFKAPADVYITNIDAATWLGKKTPKFFKHFETLIIDESTAYKHNTSARSKAVNKFKKFFNTRRLASGTPTAGNISDLWNQVYIIDDGDTFGTSFTRFRQMTMDSTQVGPMANMVKWRNKQGIEEVVASMMQNMNIRHKFDDCVSIPDDFKYSETYYMPTSQQKAYKTMKATASVMLKKGEVNAVNAAAVTTKLLQIASGAVYDGDGRANLVDTGRYELIMEMISQRDHTVCFFNWRHQREELTRLADKLGITYCYIDGTVGDKDRLRYIRGFQNGDYQAIFLHPQSAAHGITLTTANTTIWASPTYMGDIFLQGNARIRRAGQKRKTETILIRAAGTIEESVYKALEGKLDSIKILQEVLEA